VEIEYQIGDATIPVAGNVIIAHICNNVGKWGRGFVVPLGKKYPKAKDVYLNQSWEWDRGMAWASLGKVDIVPIGEGVWVANMIAQNDVGATRRVDLDALFSCLCRVAVFALTTTFAGFPPVVQMPRIGTGLGRAKWEDIEPLIRSALCDKGVRVVVLDLAPL